MFKKLVEESIIVNITSNIDDEYVEFMKNVILNTSTLN